MRSATGDGPLIVTLIADFLRHDLALSITEYAIAAGLIAAAIVVSFTALGTAINAMIVTVVAFL